MKSFGCCLCPVDRADLVPRPATPKIAFYRAGRYRAGRDQAGVALITVLLIVFLASIAATSLAALQQMAIRRSTILQHQHQARLYALGAEQWAMLVLARDRKQNETDHPGETWANLPPALPVEGGTLSASLRDLQGRFNLNSLWQPASSTAGAPASGSTDRKNESENSGGQAEDEEDQERAEKNTDQSGSPPGASKPADTTDTEGASGSRKARLNEAQFQVLQRLLTSLELKPELAQAIVDWLDPDQDPLFPDGAEDSDYNVQTPPYLAANRPLISVSELRLIKGVDQEVYDKLVPLVCALSPDTPLNVNTAPAIVLAALGERQDPKDMERLLEDRPDDGYKNVDDFLSAAHLTVNAQLKAQLSVSSQHFLLRAEARVGDGRAMLYSILYRDKNGVRVLQRSFGNQD